MPSSMGKSALLLISRKQKLLLWTLLVSTLCLLLITHAWTPPAIGPPVAMAFFKRTDPNSIDGRIPIGYWTDDDGPGSAQNAVDKDWDPAEREMVTNYLKNAPNVLQQWRGLAFCRLCGEANGNSCVGDTKFNWPQGYLHYIEKHHVKPPQNFIDHVREQTNLVRK